MIRTRSSSLVTALAAGALGAIAVAAPSDARACGGIFVQAVETPEGTSIVRDHRMAIAIGRDQTVVWDEVRLQGDPKGFVWITPVKPGTSIELATDEWLSALDVSTQPVVYAPRAESGGGCALAGCAASEDTSTAPPAGSVFVVKEEVLGPYDSVTVRAAGDPDAPYRWLTANGYRIDDDKVRATLAAFAQEGFDFAALKLHATCNQTAMRPVRIVIPGPEPKILVRMALAGARVEVPITLFVLGEAPYRPASYPSAPFDDDQLVWDRKTSSPFASPSDPSYAPRSNYDDVADAIMAREGRTWLVEAAFEAELAGSPGKRPTPGLYEAYASLCSGAKPRSADERSGYAPSSTSSATPAIKPPCVTVDDAGIEETDAGPDAGPDADADADAGSPTTTEDAAAPMAPSPPGCSADGENSDYVLAVEDVIGAPHVYVTRLRARIQPNALASDLDLAPVTGQQTEDISNLHQVARYDDQSVTPSRRSCATTKMPRVDGALGAAAAIALTAWLRRRRR